MKAVLLSIMALIFTVTTVFADNGINAASSTIPNYVESFILQHFNNVNVADFEYDDDDFEVRLSNGIKIEFSHNGQWEEIKGHGNAIPLSVLPSLVAATVNKNHPQATMIKVEREWNGYKIKLNSGIKLFIDGNGTLLGQKQDR